MALQDLTPFWVDFPFRENRTYVHSGSICNYWRDRAPDAESFDIVLKHWMAHRLVFTPLAEGVAPGGQGHVIINEDGARRIFEISEDMAHPVVARVAYDEDAVPKAVDVSGGACEVAPLKGFTFFDRVISGNKALINEVLNPGVKLIAAKISTKGFPSDDAPITLKLKGNVGHRVFKSALLVNGELNGEVIYYGE
ncbi:hypothetical protein [Sinisalibacter aestuarii]|uniref:Uncharacterized protein n=1 Tax=Sinisalibacter aestuarii TaxID=2949426 RepID=A0ABQ5LSN5_9RHOB|nr:hypothetical protein [Sinisalibacter aestuarii]GKY88006.1 hypothetical protein STA1M1_18750 [Sinisalibacter aestuarii]